MRSFALAAVAALVVSGCLAAPAAQEAVGPSDPLAGALPPVVLLEDAAGDATSAPCDTGDLTGSVLAPVRAACASVAPGLRPASPALDILAVEFQESPTSLVVAMRLAALDESWSGALADDRSELPVYLVRWRHSEEDFVRGGALHWDRLWLVVEPSDEGPSFDATFRTSTDGEGGACNHWASCVYGVPVTVEYGAPATLRWTIPREALPNDAPGDELFGLAAFAVQDRDAAARGRFDETWLPDRTIHPAGVADGRPSVADSAAGDARFAFALPRHARAPGEYPPVLDARGDTTGDRPAPDLDILQAVLEETPTTLAMRIQLARVAATGTDVHLEFEIGLSDGKVFTLDAHPHDEMRLDWSYYCLDPEYEAACERPIDAVPDVAVEEGEPGWIHFTFDRALLGELRAGDLSTVTEIEVYDYEEPTGVPALANAYVAADTSSDFLALPAFRYRWSSAPPPTADALHVQDAEDDADSFPLDGDGSRYDVSHLSAQARAPDVVGVTVGVRGLANVEPPPGWDAVLYAAALETAMGPTLLGYYKHREAEGEFFCAPDTLLLAEERTLPERAFRRAIEGSLTGNSSKQQGSSSERERGGAVAFAVPHECLGLEGQGPVEVLRAAGASYLVREGRGSVASAQVRMLDEVHSARPALLEAAVVTPPVPWWDSPFGLASFWDLAGVVGAVLVSGAGVAVVQRRRRVLTRYLHEIDRIQKAHAEDPVRRERALAAVQARLKDDLVRGRIQDAHFAIVERRLEQLVSQARVEVFSETFRDLPHWLVVKLQKLLGDGVLNADDYRVLSALLESADVPATTKAKVRAKLAGWVAGEAVVSDP